MSVSKHLQLVALFGLLLGANAFAAPAKDGAGETTWMKVLLDGRKIGSMQSTRVVLGDRVTTTERMEVTMDRAGMSLAVSTEESSIETREGKPIGFGARIAMSGIATEIEGTLQADGKASVVVKSGGRDETRSIDWPPGAVLAEGAHVAERAHGLTAGTKYRVLSFQPSELTAIAVDVEVKGPVSIDIDGKPARVHRSRPTHAIAWSADANAGVGKRRSSITQSVDAAARFGNGIGRVQ